MRRVRVVMPAPIAPMLLIAPDAQLPEAAHVWGTGGWLGPEEREALDWLALARMLGWGVDRVVPDAEAMAARGAEGRRWIVVACEPALINPSIVALLRSWLARSAVVVIGRAGATGSPWCELGGVAATGDEVSGVVLRWHGESGPTWRCREPFASRQLRTELDASPLADVDGFPVVVKRQVGRGSVVALAFHPSAARDANGAATALLREMLIRESPAPVAWVDFEHTLALRMDDPGAAQNVHLESWRYRQLDGPAWAAIGAELEARAARLSVGYVGGWVDDGDATRGTLTVGGRAVERQPGRVHPSPQVIYESPGDAPLAGMHDYAGQYRALCSLQARMVVGIELHGFTHMHPDSQAWAAAPDRYEDVGWYRELGARALPFLAALPPESHPLVVGMKELQRHFGERPSTLICPGDQWTHEAFDVALSLGLAAVSSYYYAFRHDGRFCWAQHVCAPYLDEADGRWFDSGLPVVGYFHDADVALHGIDWLTDSLDAWSAAGARRFVTLRELAAASQVHIDVTDADGAWVLDVYADHAITPTRLPVRIRMRDGAAPLLIEVEALAGTRRYALDDAGRWTAATLVSASAVPR